MALQNALHRGLEVFINGYGPTKFSLLKRPSRMVFADSKVIDEIDSILCGFLTNEQFPIHTSASREVSASEWADCIARGYRTLAKYVSKLSVSPRHPIPVCSAPNEWFQQLKSSPSREPVREFSRQLYSFSVPGLIGAWVHGSLGTLDEEVGYSDLDTILLLSAQAVSDAQRLLSLREKLNEPGVQLFLYDPLQHHGFFVITEVDLEAYPEAYFPIKLFKYASPNLRPGQPKLFFSSRDDSKERIAAFNEAVQTVITPLPSRISWSAYAIKAYLQTVILLPALYLQVRDANYLYKRDTFAAAKVDFTEAEWDIIDKATRLRENWKFRSLFPVCIRRCIGLWLNMIALSVLHRVESLLGTRAVLRVIGQDFVTQSQMLAQAMLDKSKSMNN